MQKSLKTFQIYPRLKLKRIRNERKHHQAGQQQLLRNHSWTGEVAQWWRHLPPKLNQFLYSALCLPRVHLGMRAHPPNKVNKCKRVIKTVTAHMKRKELFAISFSLKWKPMQEPLSLLLLLKAAQGKMLKAVLKGEKDSLVTTQDVVISIERPEGEDGSAVKG